MSVLICNRLSWCAHTRPLRPNTARKVSETAADPPATYLCTSRAACASGLVYGATTRGAPISHGQIPPAKFACRLTCVELCACPPPTPINPPPSPSLALQSHPYPLRQRDQQRDATHMHVVHGLHPLVAAPCCASLHTNCIRCSCTRAAQPCRSASPRDGTGVAGIPALAISGCARRMPDAGTACPLPTCCGGKWGQASSVCARPLSACSVLRHPRAAALSGSRTRPPR